LVNISGNFPFQGRLFFSEEKNQKTFEPARFSTSGTWPGTKSVGFSPVSPCAVLASEHPGHLRMNSGEASSSVNASRRDPADLI
jgi:hypothetical protein